MGGVQQEMDRDPNRGGVAVLVKIDLIDELSGNVLRARADRPTA